MILQQSVVFRIMEMKKRIHYYGENPQLQFQMLNVTDFLLDYNKFILINGSSNPDWKFSWKIFTAFSWVLLIYFLGSCYNLFTFKLCKCRISFEIVTQSISWKMVHKPRHRNFSLNWSITLLYYCEMWDPYLSVLILSPISVLILPISILPPGVLERN